jgi:hypothetical protein
MGNETMEKKKNKKEKKTMRESLTENVYGVHSLGMPGGQGERKFNEKSVTRDLMSNLILRLQ